MSKKAILFGILSGLAIDILDSVIIGIIASVVILIIGFLLWNVWGFMRYKQKEKMYKNLVYSYIHDGMSLEEALTESFSNLNKFEDFGLSNQTIRSVCNKMAFLAEKTDTANVVEIFSAFIYRYIFKNGRVKKPNNISNEKIIYALENLDFNERNGYLVIKPDKQEDFSKKYSN